MANGLRWTEQDLLDFQKRGNAIDGYVPVVQPVVTGLPRNPMPKTKGMNGLESRYALEVLEIRKMAGEIVKWRFEAVKLRLAKCTTYTPDFMVTFPDGHIEMHETKGRWHDDARVKTKVSAEMFPEFVFYGVQWDRKLKVWLYEKF